MPCQHKFLNDLDLSYVRELGYTPTTLIVGTFNPAWPEHPAPWFYGRTHDAHGNPSNRFWHVLPELYGHRSLMDAGVEEWKAFCRDHHIAITDMIRCIEDAEANNAGHCGILASYSDSAIEHHFHDHTANPLAELLTDHPTIERVYITRSTTNGLWRRLSQGLREVCERTGRGYTDLLTPSPWARMQFGRWNQAHPGEQVANIDALLEKSWRAVWHL